MGTRWFGTLGASTHGRQMMADPPRSILTLATNSWRAWLATGARRVPIDGRRARGANSHLKKVLMGGPSGAADFSSAMARRAIDEALNELPSERRHLVQLAYFSGLSNREIADHLGLTVGGVRRRLRESLTVLASHIEQGRAVGRKALHSLAVWFILRRLGRTRQWPGLDHLAHAGVMAAVTVAAAAALVAVDTHGPVARPDNAPSIVVAGPAGSHLVRVAAKPGGTRAGIPGLPVVVGGVQKAVAAPAVSRAENVLQQLVVTLPVRLPVQQVPLEPVVRQVLGA